MMRAFLVLSVGVLSLLLVGCGSDDAKPATPPPSGSGQQPPSGSKWSGEEYTQAVKRCAETGNTQYTRDQWNTFCGCVYTTAAQRWTLQEFSRNFNQYYSQLVADKTIPNCLKSANMQ